MWLAPPDRRESSLLIHGGVEGGKPSVSNNILSGRGSVFLLLSDPLVTPLRRAFEPLFFHAAAFPRVLPRSFFHLMFVDC